MHENAKIIVSVSGGVLLAFLFVYFFPFPSAHHTDREIILQEIQLGIQSEMEKGNYGCCIDPPCDMCYLGNWIWDDGSCKCDEMIANGELDKVCPQCKKGIEEGNCESSDQNLCEYKLEQVVSE